MDLYNNPSPDPDPHPNPNPNPGQVTVTLYQMLEASMDITSDLSASAVCAVFIEALASAHTHAPGPPCGTYGLRLPAPRVLYVPETQGSGTVPYVRCTERALYCMRTSRGRTVHIAYWRTTGPHARRLQRDVHRRGERRYVHLHAQVPTRARRARGRQDRRGQGPHRRRQLPGQDGRGGRQPGHRPGAAPPERLVRRC